MSPEVETALASLVAVLTAREDESLAKVVLCDFGRSRHVGAIVSSETTAVLAELALRMNKY